MSENRPLRLLLRERQHRSLTIGMALVTHRLHLPPCREMAVFRLGAAEFPGLGLLFLLHH